jgi:hypothetical protein
LFQAETRATNQFSVNDPNSEPFRPKPPNRNNRFPRRKTVAFNSLN